MLQQLGEGDITIEELEKVNKNLGQMERLCISIPKKTENSKSGRVHDIVKQRLREFEVFNEQLGHLQQVCLFVTQDVSGM